MSICSHSEKVTECPLPAKCQYVLTLSQLLTVYSQLSVKIMSQIIYLGLPQQTKSRCDNVVTTLCFGCGNVVNATLSQRKNVDSKSRCGHVAITTLHSQPACIFMHTHIHTYTHTYTQNLIILDLGPGMIVFF